MSSTYIELDSWIYPVTERLAALGVIRIEYLGLRPWTRMQLYKMIAEIDPDGVPREASTLLQTLQSELNREEQLDSGSANKAATVDEIYTRTQYVAGLPLTDGFHFGQTIGNDFGRPYGEGLQEVSGFETRAENGRFSVYARGEFQHAPGLAPYTPALNAVIQTQDGIPGETNPGGSSQNQFRLLDTYASFNFLSNEISVGKQSYWWGPDSSTALLLGNNAEPFYSLRINRTLPLHIPLLSRLLGPLRYDNFIGKLSGDHFPAKPIFYGNKISFRPTPNLELGFSRDVVFGGAGVEPLTLGNFWTSFTSVSSGTSPGFNPRTGPGARRANFDFVYRVPFLRNWLTLYADALVHDDVSPLDAPRRAAVMPGIYLARFPGIRKLDLRLEGGTTDTVTSRAEGGNFYYLETLYRDSYTDKGFLLGSWLGREGTGGAGWLTYWFSPQTILKIGFRDLAVSHFFVPNGLTQKDGYGSLDYQWKDGIHLQFFLQGERWNAPVLAPRPQHNVTTQIQVSFNPKEWTLKSD
jgi:Capsule assembly protein Wzi